MQVRPVGIAGVGAAVPKQVLTNADLEKMVETSDEWITSRTGIRERRIAGPGEGTVSLGTEAARRALAAAGLGPEDVDLILVGTVTPDMIFPSAACQIQDALGCTRAAAADLSAACPGFIYALSLGAQTIASGFYETVLVIGAETLSRIVDWQDRSTCVLFGDGAGAAVLRPARPGRGLVASVLGADGSGAEHLYMPAGGSARPASFETVEQRQHFLRMNGSEVMKFAVRVMVSSTQEALAKAGLQVADLDWLIPHQANTRIIDAAIKRLGVDPEKVPVTVDRYGNTSSASIPITLAELVEQGQLTDGQLVGLVSFGAGLTWGANLLYWGV